MICREGFYILERCFSRSLERPKNLPRDCREAALWACRRSVLRSVSSRYRHSSRRGCPYSTRPGQTPAQRPQSISLPKACRSRPKGPLHDDFLGSASWLSRPTWRAPTDCHRSGRPLPQRSCNGPCAPSRCCFCKSFAHSGGICRV